tara:strand:- start:291 stop:497 length:207 start_codon:yes stop_codon:yes gene_type:complete
MGVIIKILDKVELPDNKCEYIELEFNEPNVFHIQNKVWRLEMSPKEFGQFCLGCIKAGRKLKQVKNID